ncbi:MauE/DoxX family redox-associated membrane protein [Spirillospora sp. NPDC050679]
MIYLSVWADALIVLLFGVSTLSKIRNRTEFDEFAGSVQAVVAALPGGAFRGRPGARRAAGAVAAAEAAIPLLVVVPATTLAGHLFAMVLLALFCAGIAAALRRAVRPPCRCFGGKAAPLGVRHLVRNSLLAAVALAGALLSSASWDGAQAAGTAAALFAAMVFGLLIIRLDDIIDLFHPLPNTGGR